MSGKDGFLQNSENTIEEEFDISKIDFEKLRSVDVRTVDINTLVDLNDVKIDTSLPKEQRMIEFVRQVKNPYCFRVGKVAVSVGFSNYGVTFEQRMEHYIQTL